MSTGQIKAFPAFGRRYRPPLSPRDSFRYATLMPLSAGWITSGLCVIGQSTPAQSEKGIHA
jgi:hypothetical protein